MHIPMPDFSWLDDPPEVDAVWREIEAREADDEKEYQEYQDWLVYGDPPDPEETAAWDAYLESLSPEELAELQASCQD